MISNCFLCILWLLAMKSLLKCLLHLWQRIPCWAVYFHFLLLSTVKHLLIITWKYTADLQEPISMTIGVSLKICQYMPWLFTFHCPDCVAEWQKHYASVPCLLRFHWDLSYALQEISNLVWLLFTGHHKTLTFNSPCPDHLEVSIVQHNNSP